MSTPKDAANDGPVKASRVTRSTGLSAGFDYGDQEDQTSTAAAYQFKTQETSITPNLNTVATLPAPAYDSTANTEEKETETTQLKSEGEGLTASAAAPDDEGSDDQPNNTGLPDSLKSGVENLSGVSLDDVNVHYNSTKPAQLKAHAYAQGTDIHLGAGQEKHLPHEAWHVVQQKQGRVKPTMQMKGKVPVNDDAGLEKEADVMGAKALQGKFKSKGGSKITAANNNVVQRIVINLDPTDDVINAAVPNIAKRDKRLDTFQNDEQDDAFVQEMDQQMGQHEQVHHQIMEKSTADFSHLDNSNEPIIFAGHGVYTGEFDQKLGGFGRIMRILRPQLGFQLKFWNSFSGKKLGKFLIKRGLPKTYRGQIFADGCNTATGPEVGAPKAFIDELADYLQKEGYDFVSVKGNLGWAGTGDDGMESNQSPMVQTELAKSVARLQKLEPTVVMRKNADTYDDFAWRKAHTLHKLEQQLEKLKEEDGAQELIEAKKSSIARTKSEVAGFGFRDGTWSSEHTKEFENFTFLNGNTEIKEFVRVRAPKKISSSGSNNGTAQLKADSQAVTDTNSSDTSQGFTQNSNNTGLPDSLKSGVENLSGVSLDDVNVHYNSTKPAQLKAHAYAQGTDIHLGAGQEKHLPHEAWHVVQQKQGRVQPTMQMKGQVPVNDDAGLEKEADVMGAKAVQLKLKENVVPTISSTVAGNVAQMAFNDKKLKELMGAYKFKKAKDAGVLEDYRNKTRDELLTIRGATRKSFDEIIEGYLTRDDDFEDAEPQSWFGWGLSAIGLGGAEGEKEGDVSHTLSQGGKVGKSGSLGGLLEEGALEDMEDSAIDNASQNKEEEEDEEGTLLEKGLKSITINLLEGKAEGEKEIGGGVGAKGKAEGGIEYTPGDQHKVTGKVAIEFELGKGGEKVVGNGRYGSDQNNMRVGGIVQGLMGVKGQASAEGEFNPKEGTYGVKGKAGASAGVSAEGKVKLVLKAKGVEVAQATMKGGVMAGLAAQGAFTLKYDKGEFTFGTAGKLAAGVGVTWSYKLSVNTPGMMAKLGDNIASFAKWGASSIYNSLPSMF